MSFNQDASDIFDSFRNIKPADYFDKFNRNPLHWKKKKGSKHEFGIEYEAVIPKDGEVRLLGNRHRQCEYYRIGKQFKF
jgi:hypothetical protein